MPSDSPPTPAARAPPSTPTSAPPPARRRATTTASLFVLVSAAALLTTSWTASSLMPAYAYRGRSAFDVQAEEEEVAYDHVSELFLLRQLARAFLAAPWTVPGAAKTVREQPAAGWPFPVGSASSGEEEDSAEEGEEAGRRTSGTRLNLSVSASVVLRARGERAPQPPASSWEGSDEYNNWAADSNNFDSWDGGADGGYRSDDLGGGGGGADYWYNSPSPSPPSPPSPPPLRFYEVAASGDEVAIEYVGPTEASDELPSDGLASSDDAGGATAAGSSSSSSSAPARRSSRRRFLTLCGSGSGSEWLCASAWHAERREARFVRLPLLVSDGGGGGGGGGGNGNGNGSNASDAASPAASSASSASSSVWFALRSVANGKLVQVAPPSDDEAWVVRTGGGPGGGDGDDDGGVIDGGSSGRIAASGLELFRIAKGGKRSGDGEGGSELELGVGLQNRATRALLNFRGIEANDGVSIRAHGDTKPRRACRKASPRTRFAVAPAPPSRQLPSAAAATGGGSSSSSSAALRPPTCVALGVATRTRSATTRLSRLPLFSVLLPSLLETIAPGNATATGLRFELRVGHDDDDPWWSSRRNAARAATRAARLARDGGYALEMVVSAHGGARGAPCHVWSQLFNASCRARCDYFYQLNDDIRLVSRGWADELVATLRANPYVSNLGIAGPLDTNNPRLMTQSFAHCTHGAVFGYYYPPHFRNWYSDDWATQVYGARNTFWRKDLEVSHELAHQGPRYAISYDDKQHLAEQITLGRQTIDRYVAAHHPNVSRFVETQIDAAGDAPNLGPGA